MAGWVGALRGAGFFESRYANPAQFATRKLALMVAIYLTQRISS